MKKWWNGNICVRESITDIEKMIEDPDGTSDAYA